MSRDLRMQIRALKHYHRQQSDLENFIHDELNEFAVQKSFLRTTQTAAINLDMKTSEVVTAESLAVFLLHSEVNLKSIEVDIINATQRSMEGEERLIGDYLKIVNRDSEEMDEASRKVLRNIETLKNELSLSRKETDQLLQAKDRELSNKERELSIREKEFAMPHQEKVKSYADLVVKLKAVLENMRRVHTRRTKELCDKHENEIQDIIQRIHEMNEKHADDIGM